MTALDLLLDAQTAVLGCMVIDADTVGPILQTVRASDFTEPTYRMIFEAIRSMFNAGEHIDPVTINDAAKKLVRLIYAMEKSQQSYRNAA